jgi:trigger factor
MNGMSTGEERELNLTFPEDYHSAELAGKPVVFKVKLKEVKTQILPDEDDEFAKDVSEFDTLAEYREDIRAKLLIEKEKEVDNEFENSLLEKLVETMTVEVPDALIEGHIDNSVDDFRNQLANYGMELSMYLSMSGTTEEAFRESMRPTAESRVKTALALEKVAELEKLEPTEEEIEASYGEVAERYGVDVEDVKEQTPRDSVVRDLNLRAALKIIRDASVQLDPSPEETKTEEPAKPSDEAEKPAAPKKPRAKKAAAPKADDKTEAASIEPAAAEEAPAPAQEPPAPKKPRAKKTPAKTEETKEPKAE